MKTIQTRAISNKEVFMKALSKKRMQQIRSAEYERQKQEYEAYLASMSDEERESYLRAREQKAAKAVAAISLASAIIPKTYY